MQPIRILFFIASIVLGALTDVHSADAATYPLPILIQSPNAPLRIKWPDGREARFYSQKTAAVEIRAPFTITSFTCSGIAPSRCQFLDTFQIVREKLVWHAHPDRTKIGKLVQVVVRNDADQKITQTYSAYLFDNTFDSVTRYGSNATALSMSIAPLGIRCEHYDFLPQASRGRVHFRSISLQQMVMNIHTGINENQLSTMFENAVFKIDANGVLRLTQVDANPRNYSRTFIESLDGIHFFDVKKGDDACQFGTNADVGALTRQAAQLQRNLDRAPSVELKKIDPATLKNLMEFTLTKKLQENVAGQTEPKTTQIGNEVQ